MIKNFLITFNKTTLFHITHWKAGSQWVHRILQQCAPDKIITPKVGIAQFLQDKVLTGKIYPTVYVSHQQFNNVVLPQKHAYFVIIRDLRDTLISAYFSLKISHQLISKNVTMLHNTLAELDSIEKGLMYLIDHWLPQCADIQKSWLEANTVMLRYEDLLKNDIELLEPVILPYVPISKKRFKEIIIANRFENLTQGRKRGEEDLNAHERKGIPGDWKNYFSESVKNEFKSRYGDLLIKTGYEINNYW